MVDLREYSDLIRDLVAKENKKDRNWKWSVKSIGKKMVRIRWGYLDYLEEKNNCFFIGSEGDADCGYWLWIKTPDGRPIDCYMVAEKPNPRIGAEMKIESGIRSAVEDIAYYAHSRY